MSTDRPKPRLRGVFDVIAALLAVPASVSLVMHAQPGRATVAAVVYGLSLFLLFFASALYHAPMWPLHLRSWLQRLDHSAIYVLIAGSYTPICALALPPDKGELMLWIVWSIATLGTLKTVLWPSAPRALNAAIYVAMGWLIAPQWTSLRDVVPAPGLWLGLAGGLLYTIGAFVYAKRLLDFWPRWLGYHEAFHLLVILAAASHYVIFWDLLTA